MLLAYLHTVAPSQLLHFPTFSEKEDYNDAESTAVTVECAHLTGP